MDNIILSQISVYNQLDFKNQFTALNIDLLSGKRMKESNNANALFQDVFHNDSLLTFLFFWMVQERNQTIAL